MGLDGTPVLGWAIMVLIQGKWELYKFTTIKKERKVQKIVSNLREKYRVKFRYQKGTMLVTQQEKQDETKTETRVEERQHVICGTDCDDPCTKTIEDAGRDWRDYQFPDEAQPLNPELEDIIERRFKKPFGEVFFDKQGQHETVGGENEDGDEGPSES